ncbi:MAG: sulfatase-like hydrolase/transferase [Pirellulaceae bacterium]
MRWIISLTLLSLTSLHSISFAQSPSPERPNILFIFADDQCFDTIRSLGNDEIQTPNLDRLVRQGTTFSHAYNMGSWSGAVCVASRAMLNTGRFLWYAQKVHNNRSMEEERAAGRFWSEQMRTAGYQTYYSGKWHVPVDASKAFDHVRHVRPGMPNQTPAGYNRPLAGQNDPWSPFDPQFEGYWKGGKHWSEVLGDDGVDYLSQAKTSDDPFFMYLAFNAPHDPRQSPQEYVDLYPAEQIRIPANFMKSYPFKDQIGCSEKLRDEHLAPFPRTEHAIQVHRQEYYAIITHMDRQIGRILDALETSGKADNTYIFFTADHGLAVGQHGLVGKQNMYDHSVRVPLIACGPGIDADQIIRTPVYLQDIMPTTLELASIEKPQHVQFQSLLPLLRHETKSHYDAIYGAYLHLQRMVTKGDYKLIVYPEANIVRLYNVARDPHEMLDLATSDAYDSLIGELFQELVQQQQTMGDELDLKGTFSRYFAER